MSANRTGDYRIMLTPAATVALNGYQDCNTPGVWIDDRYRTFHGTFHKEDDPHGKSTAIYKEGKNVIEAMTSPDSRPYKIHTSGGMDRPGIGMWIESIYQPAPNSRTLYAVYHNENTYKTINDAKVIAHASKIDPRNLLDDMIAKAPIIRIGLLKSTDGGANWDDLGIVLQDDYLHFVIRPHLVSAGYIGGTTDPSWIDGRDGYLYVFFTEVSYPDVYDPQTFDPVKEASGQGISVARIRISDLDEPLDGHGGSKVMRWDGKGFHSPGIGGTSFPIPNLKAHDASAVSQNLPHINWGPSVSWNTHLEAWTMTMTHACRRLLRSDDSYISFNPNRSLGDPSTWSRPVKLSPDPPADMFPFFPVFQSEAVAPLYESTAELGRQARFFFVECRVKWEEDHNFKGDVLERDRYLCYSRYNATFLRPEEAAPESPVSTATAFAYSWSDESHKGEMAADGNPDTYWEAGEELLDPAAIVYDMGCEKEIDRIFFNGTKYIDRMRIQVWEQSARNREGCIGNWADVCLTSVSPTGGTDVLIDPVRARYLRFIVTKSFGGRPQISEISAR